MILNEILNEDDYRRGRKKLIHEIVMELVEWYSKRSDDRGNNKTIIG